MDVIEAIKSRRSVKHYDPKHRLSDAEVEELIGLAMLSPTSFNMQNWRFVVVTDEAQRRKIREAAWNQAQVTDSSLLVVVCADLKAFERKPERYWAKAPEQVRNILVPMIKPFYADKPELQRDEAMRSVGLASATLMLAAKAKGLDSCPMIGFDPRAVGQIIGLPGDHVIGMMISIGKPLSPANERGGQLPLSDVLIRNRF